MPWTSVREGRLWKGLAAFQLCIYLSLGWIRTPTNWLRERGLLAVVVSSLFLLAAVWVVRKLRAARPTWTEVGVLSLFLAVFVASVLSLERVEERVHLLQYGIVGGVAYAALRERRGNLLAEGRAPQWWARSPALSALVLATAAGWGDEGIQALLPNRFYDLRDVGLNAAGGALVIAAMVARDRLRGGSTPPRDREGLRPHEGGRGPRR